MRLKIAMLDDQKKEKFRNDLNKQSAVTHWLGISQNTLWENPHSLPRSFQRIALIYSQLWFPASLSLSAHFDFPRLWKNQIQSKDVVSNTFRQLSWSSSLNYGNGRREIESEICWKSDYSDRGIQRNWWRSSQRIW